MDGMVHRDEKWQFLGKESLFLTTTYWLWGGTASNDNESYLYIFFRKIVCNDYVVRSLGLPTRKRYHLIT